MLLDFVNDFCERLAVFVHLICLLIKFLPFQVGIATAKTEEYEAETLDNLKKLHKFACALLPVGERRHQQWSEGAGCANMFQSMEPAYFLVSQCGIVRGKAHFAPCLRGCG